MWSAILPLNLAIGLAIALLMNQRVRGIMVFRSIYYLPAVTSGVAVAILWQFVFHKQWGILNAILAIFGVQPIGWLVDPNWVMVAFVIMSVWGVGGSMIIYLAGLQSIPTELYESAAIDGANGVRKFWHITLPMLTPTIFFVLITGLIGAFQIFESAYIMTGGGPNYATYFFGLNIYFTAFQSLRFAYAVNAGLDAVCDHRGADDRRVHHVAALGLLRRRPRGSIGRTPWRPKPQLSPNHLLPPSSTAHRHISRRQMMKQLHLCAVIFSGALLMVPFFWMLSTSLKTLAEVQTWPIVWIPSKFVWANYPAVFQKTPFARYLLNSL